MIKKIIKAIMLCSFWCVIVIVSLNVWYAHTEKEYYSDKENFTTDDGIVEKIIDRSEDDRVVVLWLSDISDDFCYNKTGCSEFKIKGKNLELLLERGLLEKIALENEIKYVSAPGYFGDGYIRPIISLTIDREELLSFEEGYKNLMRSYWFIL